MDKYKIKDLAQRLQKEETTELKNKMLFMWTKQEVITLKEYNELVKLILYSVSQQRELLSQYNDYLNMQYQSSGYDDTDISDFFEWLNCG